MLETVKMFIQRAECFDAGQAIEPSEEMPEDWHFVGYMTDPLRVLFTLCMQTEKERDLLAVNVKFSSRSVADQNARTLYELNHTLELYSRIFSFELRSHFDMWDKARLGVFVDYKVAYCDIPDIKGILMSSGFKPFP